MDTLPQKTVNTILIISVGVLILAGIMAITGSYEVYHTAQKFAGANSNATNSGFISANPIKEGYAQALSYFIIAISLLIVIIILPRISTLSFGTSGINVTLKDLEQKVTSLQTLSNAAQGMSTGVGGTQAILEKLSPIKRDIAEMKSIQNPEHPDDPQKGKWGGLAQVNKRTMQAKITPASIPNYYTVVLTVTNTADGPPLIGLVKFHLHNTFQNPNPIIAVQDGKAILTLNMVWGGFTAGAEADEDGKTHLELDLAELPNAPKEFKER